MYCSFPFLLTLWVLLFVISVQAPSTDISVSELSHASAEVSEIVFFLLGAMTIVEIVDAHQGFKMVTDNITTRKPKTLLWVVGIGFIVSYITSICCFCFNHTAFKINASPSARSICLAQL